MSKRVDLKIKKDYCLDRKFNQFAQPRSLVCFAKDTFIIAFKHIVASNMIIII